MEMFKCKGPCGEWKPGTSFYSRNYKNYNEVVVKLDTICKKCRFEERQGPEYKINAKVRNAISNEAEKLGVNSEQLHSWGITFEWVKYMLEREMALVKLGFQWCPNCHGNPDKEKICYKEEDINQDNFTFDVIDPERMYRTKKLTRSNCRWICETANWAKGNKDPTLYDIEVIETYIEQQALREGFQAKLPQNQPLQPSLF